MAIAFSSKCREWYGRLTKFNLRKRLKERNRLRIDADSRAYIHFARKHWPRRDSSLERVVLVGMFDSGLILHSIAKLGNYLADHYQARLATSAFVPYRSPTLDAIFTALGAPIELSFDQKESFERQAREDAEKVFYSLADKSDVQRISRQGVALGDLIYDTYLRVNLQATLQIDDLKLRTHIYDAFLIYDLCDDYLNKNKVVALVSTDNVYLFDGVLQRLCTLRGIPSFGYISIDPLVVMLNSADFLPGDKADYRNWPARLNSRNMKKLYDDLSPERKQAALGWAKEDLERRLSGKPDFSVFVFGSGTAFQAPAKERLMKETGRPRILVMLHDFCDGCYTYPTLPFYDFLDWTVHTMDLAAKTPYDWYIKPHPLRYDRGVDKVTAAFVAEYKDRHPNVHFLARECSNRQLIEEGVSSLFTCYGTCALEFAYLNIPVVCAGSPYRDSFNFSFFPRSIEEYDKLIAAAGHLKIDINKQELLVCYYITNRRYTLDRIGMTVSLTPRELLESPDYVKIRYFSKSYLRLVAEHWNAEHDAETSAALDMHMELFKPELLKRVSSSVGSSSK